MPHFYEHINILVMPTDACNMDCVYCFHTTHQSGIDFMSIETVKQILDITTPFYKRVNLIWHGGEPLLLGLDFYKEVVRLQKLASCKITNSVQSNLTLMTPELAKFFADNNFNVSGSFDGVINAKTRGHDNEIMTGRQFVIESGKRCGVIMVVSNLNINHLIESYRFFKEIDVNFSLNLYLDQEDNKKDYLQLNENTAIIKLIELFDYWANDINGNIHISYFKNILDFILFRKKGLCTYTSCMGRWIGIRYNGEIGPCNRYFPAEYSYGNVYDYSSIGDAFESAGFMNLLSKAIIRREKCKACEIYHFCNGGCNNTAMNENGIENNEGLSCRILVSLYKHINDFINNALSSKSQNNSINPLLKKMLNDSIKEKA